VVGLSSIKGRYAKIEIPLNKPESDKELFLTGDYLSLISITGNGSCEIKLDHRHSQSIDLREITEISGFFDRVFFTTDGDGGTCTCFVGTGMHIHVTPDPQKLRNGGIACAQITCTTDTVEALSNGPYLLNNITILNSSGVYTCYVGPYNPDPATFKAHAYVLLPHKTLDFTFADMYALAVISYDGVNTPTLNIIGTYE
jgi:hypothetical protein